MKIDKELVVLIIYAIILAFLSFFIGRQAAAEEKLIKIAVIDSGFDFKYKNKVKLCKNGHKDFTRTNLQDKIGHGTHVAGIIAKNVKVNYCLVIIKFLDPNYHETEISSALAINWAILQGVDVINYSGGGLKPYEPEKQAVIRALNKKIVFVAAAGNEASNLKFKPYFPASYDKRAIVVGALAKNGKKAAYSSFGGPLDLYVVGNSIRSLNGYMSGTSQATAVVTGRVVNQIYSKKYGRNINGKIEFEYEKYIRDY